MGGLYNKTLGQLTKSATLPTIVLNNISADPYATILQFFTTKETLKFIKTELGQYDLKLLDQIRDVILHNKGNEALILYGTNLNETNNGSSELASMFTDLINSQTNKLGGMLLKTYDSDIFNNWIQTDWIDGAGGITELTSIDITANDGKLTMDALNLQQKVYNMLNRIAVSGGTYRDWLETVYTAGKYLDRPETPVFIGGMTQYIEFDEVISKMPGTTVGVLMSITPITRVKLQKYPLEDIDLMRDLIYSEKGNTTTIITANYPGYSLPLYQSFVKRLASGKLNTTLYRDWETDRKSTRLNSSHEIPSRMPSSA